MNDTCNQSWAQWAFALVGQVATGLIVRILITIGVILFTIYGGLDATLKYVIDLIGLITIII